MSSFSHLMNIKGNLNERIVRYETLILRKRSEIPGLFKEQRIALGQSIGYEI